MRILGNLMVWIVRIGLKKIDRFIFICSQNQKIKFEFKFKIILPMQGQLTEYLLSLTFSKNLNEPLLPLSLNSRSSYSSQEILNNIYNTLNSQKNFKTSDKHKSSFCSEQSTSQIPTKCNCKKSKCLKLYCECFAKGSFCSKDCNCDCCQNKEQFSEIRARAIDEIMIKRSMPFGYKSLSMKGCNCRKTGCKKKYCECYNQGIACNQYCKCVNCENLACH